MPPRLMTPVLRTTFSDIRLKQGRSILQSFFMHMATLGAGKSGFSAPTNYNSDSGKKRKAMEVYSASGRLIFEGWDSHL